MTGIIKVNICRSCSECVLNYDQCCCIITGSSFEHYANGTAREEFDSTEHRLPDCPIVLPVPSPGKVENGENSSSIKEEAAREIIDMLKMRMKIAKSQYERRPRCYNGEPFASIYSMLMSLYQDIIGEIKSKYHID